jgi:hypothetical protein
MARLRCKSCSHGGGKREARGANASREALAHRHPRQASVGAKTRSAEPGFIHCVRSAELCGSGTVRGPGPASIAVFENLPGAGASRVHPRIQKRNRRSRKPERTPHVQEFAPDKKTAKKVLHYCCMVL